MRSFLTFEAPAADSEAATGECPPGRELALLLARGTAERGIRIQESVHQHDSYGWYFVVEVADERIWCMLQRSDQWLLIAKPEVGLLRRLFGSTNDQSSHRKVCEAVHAAACGISGVSDIRWFSEEEFHNQGSGAKTP